MDFLGLMNLTVIQTTLEIIERTRETHIEIAHIPLGDSETFGLLQRGDTTGVFQLESAGMRRYLKQLKPTEFGDITAMVALYRPGPMEWIPSFIKRKHGQEEVKYVHRDLEPILKPTYGIGLYQEQILQIAQVFAGFSLGEADILRRAIGKKIKKELDAQREKFIAGAKAKGYAVKLAEEIFDEVITPFAGYGFNKSHAAGYARIAYETAYLKAHYPAEFMAALLSSDAQRTDRVMIEIEECRAMGIEVLPPDINESLRHFTVVDAAEKAKGAIRFGLSAIKGIGDSTVQQIIAIREAGGRFTSIEDFASRTPARVLNKKLLESLAKSGALDSLGPRHVLVAHYDLISDFAKDCGDVSSEQAGLFSQAAGTLEAAAIDFPKTADVSIQQKLQWEKETLGLYVSSHPLAGLKKYISKKAQLIAHLSAKDVGKKVTLAGIVESVKKITTKKGETMAVVLLEDPTGKIEVTLFPKIYAEIVTALELPDAVLVLGGRVDARGGLLQVRADAVKKASLTAMITRAKEEGFFDEEEARHGLTLVQPMIEEERIEMVDEEGNVIAGETAVIAKAEEDAEFLGPLSKWILGGMDVSDMLKMFGFSVNDYRPATNAELSAQRPKTGDGKPESALPPSPNPVSISIHTIALPPKAPKKLLLELKRVLETFPGKEKIQLKIGEQLIALPLTVNYSTILEKKIDEVLSAYAVQAE